MRPLKAEITAFMTEKEDIYQSLAHSSEEMEKKQEARNNRRKADGATSPLTRANQLAGAGREWGVKRADLESPATLPRCSTTASPTW